MTGIKLYRERIKGYNDINFRYCSPTIDGRRGVLKVRESLEEQTMNMARSAKKLLEENIRYSNGESVKIFRPSAWNAFGMDKEGADYRVCRA